MSKMSYPEAVKLIGKMGRGSIWGSEFSEALAVLRRAEPVMGAIEKVHEKHLEEDIAELGPFDRGDAILRAALAYKEPR
jgi:hypothetical protein